MKQTIDYRKIFTILSLLAFLLYSTPTISQNVSLITQEDVDAFDQSITEIDGDLRIGTVGGTSNISNLENLSNLQSVKRNLYIWENDSLKSLEGLNALSFVGFDIIIRDNKSLEDLLVFENLNQINRKLIIEENAILTDLDDLSSVQNINSAIEILHNDELLNIDGLKNTDSLTQDLIIRFNEKLTNINGLSNIVWIGGALDIVFNEELIDISGLLGLQSVGKSMNVRGGSGITSYFGLDSLKTVGENVTISYMPNLTDLSGLNSLAYIGQDIAIFEMANLKNINALSSLHTIERTLTITDNPSLNNLNGLSNLSYVGNHLRIFSNESLSNCCGVQYVIFDPNSVNGVVQIGSNQSGCESKDVIIGSDCNIPILKGIVFYDSNENGIKEENEFGIPNASIYINQDGVTRLTNNSGLFRSLAVDGAQYNVSIELEAEWKITSDSMEYNFEFTEEDLLTQNLNFGIVKEEPLSLSQINCTSDETRCNSEVDFYIRFANNGHHVESGYIIFNIDTSTTYVTSTPTMTLNESELKYEFNDISPFESSEFMITLVMPTEQSTGDIIQFDGEVYYYNINNEDILKDSFNYESLVLCSYDPNDKQVSPLGVKEERFTLIEDELNFTIRFQNTGNAHAINVRIRDTLDQNLDIETFDVTNSSFPVYTTVKSHEIEFFFEDIYLPDSLSNEKESHGFVTYTIKANADINELTVINNTAHIIFDSNPAIITNTTMNTMVETICDDKFVTINDTICEGQDYLDYSETGNYLIEYPLGVTCDSLVDLNLEVLVLDHPKCTVNVEDINFNNLYIYPNPSTGIFKIFGGHVQHWQLFDLQGILLRQESTSNLINLSSQKQGIYMVKIYYADKVQVFRIFRN